jgi:hypothetical protein
MVDADPSARGSPCAVCTSRPDMTVVMCSLRCPFDGAMSRLGAHALLCTCNAGCFHIFYWVLIVAAYSVM